MLSLNREEDVPLRTIIGSLVLGADHALTLRELLKVVEEVEQSRREQSGDAPDVSDMELEAMQAQADIDAGRKFGTIPGAEAERALSSARAAREEREKSAHETPLSSVCTPAQIRQAVQEIRKELSRAGIGLELVEINGGYRFQTSPSSGPWVRQMLNKGRAAVLSRPSIETLAIIAYRQPVSRSEIESVRGVSAGHVIKALMELQLVRIVGRSDLPGRPFLFGTTPLFLEHFGLKSLDDLEKIAGAGDLLRASGTPAASKPSVSTTLKVK